MRGRWARTLMNGATGTGSAGTVKKDSCNLMWTAERPRSAELKLQILELKQED